MREAKFSILKALAIILVVVSHAGVPGWMNHALFMIHVPAFFLCAGYFFNTRYLHDERTFVMHRLKGLYWPFVRWSVFFLIVHNLLFPMGILSETYSHVHPFTWQQFSQHLWSVVFNMSGYDNCLCGTFWFFRSLLLASLAYLVLFKVLGKSDKMRTERQVGWGILILAFVLLLWKTTCNLQMTGVANGGFRELMALLLMASGFLIRQYRLVERITWKWALPCLLFLVFASVFFPSSMTYNGSLADAIGLPLPAIAAFLLLAYLSGTIEKHSAFLTRWLSYIGERTLYVFAFQFVAFKLVSALKVAVYGLPWEAVGSHPIVSEPSNNVLFVLLYVVAGVALPLLWLAGYQLVASRVTISEKQFAGYAIVGAQRICRFVYLFGRGIVLVVQGCIRSIIDGIKAIKDASSPKEE